MKLGTVIGRVTLSVTVPALEGGRWLVVSPQSRGQLKESQDPADVRVGPDSSLIAWDDLGAGVGETIGYVEGREAASVFEKPTPIDAINAALIDHIFYNPKA